MLVINQEGKIFLGERAGNPGIWQFPQGGVEENKSLEESVLRELHEELGVEESSLHIIRKLDAVNEYDWTDPPAYGKGKWRGQSQTYWLVEFTGDDREINLSRFEDEFMSWRWCTLQEVRMLAEPKRLPAYERALAEIEGYLTAYC